LEQVRISELTKLPYLRVITYPIVSVEEANKRIEQMEKIGVESIIFTGKTKVGNISVLGLGTVSVVVKAPCHGREYALKIRRVDSNRTSMNQEFEITNFVNRIGIGPVVFSHTEDLLLMELVEGTGLEELISSLKGKGKKAFLTEIIHRILNQCRKLDIAGVDHGQLSNLRKHVLISKRGPVLIDFESASRERRPRNVTSAVQYLLIGSSISPRIRKILGIKEDGEVKKLLRDYKERQDDYTYSKLLEVIGIRM